MSTRKSMTFPIILTFVIIVIIVYFFVTIKQTEVVCNKTNLYDGNIQISEEIHTMLDGKKIIGMNLTKTFILPDKFADEDHFDLVRASLNNTLEYLGDKVKYNVLDNKLIVTINVHNDELLLLDNIEFFVNDDIQIHINSNTKSSDVITLKIGDNYSDGEFMKRMKNNGYSCK